MPPVILLHRYQYWHLSSAPRQRGRVWAAISRGASPGLLSCSDISLHQSLSQSSSYHLSVAEPFTESSSYLTISYEQLRSNSRRDRVTIYPLQLFTYHKKAGQNWTRQLDQTGIQQLHVMYLELFKIALSHNLKKNAMSSSESFYL